MRTRIQVLLLVSWSALAVLSGAFLSGRGFAYVDDGTLRWTSGLQSSGGDDDVVILVGIAFGALGAGLAAIRLLRRRTARWPDVIGHGALAAAQFLYLGLIEVGQFGATITAPGGWILALWCVAYATVLGSVVAGLCLKTATPAEARRVTVR